MFLAHEAIAYPGSRAHPSAQGCAGCGGQSSGGKGEHKSVLRDVQTAVFLPANHPLVDDGQFEVARREGGAAERAALAKLGWSSRTTPRAMGDAT